MNVLLTLNSHFAKYAVVMLHSLYVNNSETNISLYILHEDLTAEDKNEIVKETELYDNDVQFIQIDSSKYQGFPTTETLTKEVYFICMAHEELPHEMDRILYLDADLIVDNDISELYGMDFDGNYLIACGQSFNRIRGNYYRGGAQAERGELFNTGVMVFNLGMMRQDVNIESFRDIAESVSYQWDLGDQGLFNIFYENKVKIISSYKYNFRIGILERYLKGGNEIPGERPCIYHFVMRDYYRIGRPLKPWQLMLSDDEEQRLYDNGFQSRPYEYRQVDDWRKKMFELWWKYANGTGVYQKLHEEHEIGKKKILQQYLNNVSSSEAVRIRDRKAIQVLLEDITENRIDDEFKKITYGELERYIDELDADTAVKTMKNVFNYNLKNLQKKTEPIKVAFLVYSSAEWQCEGLYRLMEQDDAFAPSILVCAYAHGTDVTIRNTYIQTCTYFRRRKMYNVEYLGYCNRFHGIRMLDDYQLIFYISPYSNYYPGDVALKNQLLTKLCIEVPYSYYLADRNDVYYADNDIYNDTVIKMSWLNCCQEKIEMEIAKKSERLKGYNSILSGFPKMDDYYENVQTGKSIWKTTSETKYKIIWAPHFNMKKGMNGTFNENYRWFLDYAKSHKEISWIIRPHPRMEWGTIEYGVFQNHEEYQEYLSEWDGLENASVVENGDYFDLFKTSDAMILDSLSFLAEYQYADKPLLFLHQNNRRLFNEFGEMIIDVVYEANGKDYKTIDKFIQFVIKEDPLYKKRKKFKDSVLDCRNDVGMNASRFIYSYIKEKIEGGR